MWGAKNILNKLIRLKRSLSSYLNSLCYFFHFTFFVLLFLFSHSNFSTQSQRSLLYRIISLSFRVKMLSLQIKFPVAFKIENAQHCNGFKTFQLGGVLSACSFQT